MSRSAVPPQIFVTPSQQGPQVQDNVQHSIPANQGQGHRLSTVEEEDMRSQEDMEQQLPGHAEFHFTPGRKIKSNIIQRRNTDQNPENPNSQQSFFGKAISGIKNKIVDSWKQDALSTGLIVFGALVVFGLANAMTLGAPAAVVGGIATFGILATAVGFGMKAWNNRSLKSSVEELDNTAKQRNEEELDEFAREHDESSRRLANNAAVETNHARRQADELQQQNEILQYNLYQEKQKQGAILKTVDAYEKQLDSYQVSKKQTAAATPSTSVEKPMFNKLVGAIKSILNVK